MTDQPFTIEHEGGVARLTLSRPDKRNALGLSFWEDFPDAVEELDRSGDVRALVIASTGPHFCSGLDLAAFSNVQKDELGAAAGLDFMHVVERMQRAFDAIEAARMPVIAAIQGGCIGGGVDLVTACDIRLCTADAFFTIYEIEIGMTADVGTFPRILHHLPEGIVRELAYTGRRMPAEEAERRGLVNRVLDTHEALVDAANALAADIASKPPLAVHGCKRVITHGRDHKTSETLEWIRLWNASMLQRSELMAAMGAKQTGKPGVFAPLPPRRRVDE